MQPVNACEMARLEDAIAHYTDSLRLNPDDKKAHNSLGIVLAEQGKVDDAISHFQEASRIMEGMLEMQPLNQRFRAPALEAKDARCATFRFADEEGYILL